MDFRFDYIFKHFIQNQKTCQSDRICFHRLHNFNFDKILLQVKEFANKSNFRIKFLKLFIQFEISLSFLKFQNHNFSLKLLHYSFSEYLEILIAKEISNSFIWEVKRLMHNNKPWNTVWMMPKTYTRHINEEQKLVRHELELQLKENSDMHYIIFFKYEQTNQLNVNFALNNKNIWFFFFILFLKSCEIFRKIE
jgi:hypothetical protein